MNRNGISIRCLLNLKEKPRSREIVAWFICLVLSTSFIYRHNDHSSINISEFVATDLPHRAKSGNDIHESSTSLVMNDRLESYYDKRRLNAVTASLPYYETAIVHPSSAGLVSRTWHSNSAPSINSDLQQGSCWCSADDWCMCTPSLAVDVILLSGENSIWLVRRRDTGQVALMGGFTEVGETSEETVHRELKEEMNIELPENSKPTLFGVYNDPRRDVRRHTTSVVFVAQMSENISPAPGDDATHVLKISLDDVDQYDFFIDHKTIIHDFINSQLKTEISQGSNMEAVADKEPFKRSFCPV